MTYKIDGKDREIDKDIIRDVIHKRFPRKWKDEGIEDVVDEICFRIESLELENIDFIPEEKYSNACIDYIFDMGDGDVIGIDLLINEEDDCNIWDYL